MYITLKSVILELFNQNLSAMF